MQKLGDVGGGQGGLSPRVAGSGVICQKKWGMISAAHFESKRCYFGATYGVSLELNCYRPGVLSSTSPGGERRGAGMGAGEDSQSSGRCHKVWIWGQGDGTGGLAYPEGGI